MVDAHALGACGATHGGSSPLPPIIFRICLGKCEGGSPAFSKGFLEECGTPPTAGESSSAHNNWKYSVMCHELRNLILHNTLFEDLRR